MDIHKLPKVSIVIPVYNVAPYIEACLESICNQHFTDFEILLIDDKGTDNSIGIADKFLRAKGNINYSILAYGFNGGLSIARNCGLEAAKGEAIIFLDSDDTIEPQMIGRLYELLTPEVDISVCGLKLVFPERGVEQALPQPVYNGPVPAAVVLEAALKGSYQCQIVKHLFRKSVFKEVRFPERMIYEDILTLPNILLQAGKVNVVPDPLYNYIQRPRSLSRTYDPGLIRVFPVLDQNIARIKKYQDTTVALRQAVKLYEHNMLFIISTHTIFAPDLEKAKPILTECRKRLKSSVLIRMAATPNKINLLKVGLLSLLMVSPRLFLKVSKKILGAKK